MSFFFNNSFWFSQIMDQVFSAKLYNRERSYALFRKEKSLFYLFIFLETIFLFNNMNTFYTRTFTLVFLFEKYFQYFRCLETFIRTSESFLCGVFKLTLACMLPLALTDDITFLLSEVWESVWNCQFEAEVRNHVEPRCW